MTHVLQARVVWQAYLSARAVDWPPIVTMLCTAFGRSAAASIT